MNRCVCWRTLSLYGDSFALFNYSFTEYIAVIHFCDFYFWPRRFKAQKTWASLYAVQTSRHRWSGQSSNKVISSVSFFFFTERVRYESNRWRICERVNRSITGNPCLWRINRRDLFCRPRKKKYYLQNSCHLKVLEFDGEGTQDKKWQHFFRTCSWKEFLRVFIQ